MSTTDIDGPLRAEHGAYGATPTVAPEELRIVTFNVLNGGDLDAIVREFDSNVTLKNADIVLLQEVQRDLGAANSGADFLARRLGYHFVFAPARVKESGEAHGLAVLSRYPITDARVLQLKQLEVRGRHLRRIALVARLDIAGTQMPVFNVHLDTRVNHRDRIEQLRAVADAAAAVDGPVIVGGDMNTNSVTWLRRTYPVGPARQAEAVDAYMTSRCFATPTSSSGPTSRELPLLQHKLDSLFARDVDVVAMGVERAVEVSDHLPVWIDVAWPADRGPDIFRRCAD
jgi:endonuclease/exonuclease/phosphatase family metal-dependent hydrolase